MRKIKSPIDEILEGESPQKALNSLLEASAGRPTGGVGTTLHNWAAGALTVVSIYKLFQAAFNTSDPKLIGRGVNALIGQVLMKGNAILGSKIAGAAINATGGVGAYTGQGTGIRHSFTMNQPSPDYLINRKGPSKGQGGLETIRVPIRDDVHLARLEVDPMSEGYAINLYREDPIDGTKIGAPIKNYTINFTGTTPVSIQKMEASLSQAIAQIGLSLSNNRPIYRPPLMVQRKPGRPHLREY